MSLFRLGVRRESAAEPDVVVVVEDEESTSVPTAANITLTEGGDGVMEDGWVTLIDDGKMFSYLCSEVVEDNNPTLVPLSFFMDLSFPEGAEELALRHVQEQLVTNIAGQFGVSNGEGCENPITARTWLVQISSNLSDWVRDPALGEDISIVCVHVWMSLCLSFHLFLHICFFDDYCLDSCKELQVNATSQAECFVYQAKVTSGVLAGSSADVMEFLAAQLQESGDADDEGSSGTGSAPVTQNSPYHVQFLGVPQSDPSTNGGGDDGRTNLGTSPPRDTASPVTRESSEGRGDTITVVGGVLMAAFCLLFVAIGCFIYRRRQEWVREREAGGDDGDDAAEHFKNPRNGTVKDTDDADYGPRDLHADLYDEDDHLQMDGKGGVLRNSRDDEKITIDMGCNFKDQLMGVYYGASSTAAQRRRQQQGGMYGAGRATSMDSEADSWAQTDGTIGSIEQNLEPITSEV